MRTTTLCVTLVLSVLLNALPAESSPADAAISQGSRIVAGSISFESRGGEFYEDDRGKRESEWRLFPSGGYFVRDGIAVNLLIEVASLKQGNFLDQIWALGPQARYFFDLDKTRPRGSYLFVGGAYLLGQFIHDTGEIDFKREEYSLQSLKLDTGFMYMISETVGATITIFYDLSWVKQREPEKSSSRTSGNNIGFEFGFTTFLL
jgi:hypothetical protein